MKILGIETSCDESAVCLIDAQGNFGDDFHFTVLGNALSSQAKIHAQYGGVFPNLAKREHSRNLVPLLEQTLEQAGAFQRGDASLCATTTELKVLLAREPELYEQIIVFLQKCARPEIDAIAVTVGPGLEPALWVGINFARALSLVWSANRRIPIIAVNHMEGHIIMSLVNSDSARNPNTSFLNEVLGFKSFQFPMLALLISGGHTELVLSKEWQKYEIIGKTRDDAVGEAFDKVARMLGLPYPGGPQISALAERARTSDEASPHRIKLPRPMLHDDNFDFSFAGLKTAVRRLIESQDLALLRSDLDTPLRSDLESGLDAFKMKIAREFEDAVSDVLIGKTIRAVEECGAQTVVVGGGVSANKHIRACLKEGLEKFGVQLLAPPPELATDNALMIALAGYFRAAKKEFANPAELRANGNLRLGKSA